MALIALTVDRNWSDPKRPKAKPRLDWIGLAMIVAGLGLFVVGLMQGVDWGWSDPRTLGSLIGGAVLLVPFRSL